MFIDYFVYTSYHCCVHLTYFNIFNAVGWALNWYFEADEFCNVGLAFTYKNAAHVLCKKKHFNKTVLSCAVIPKQWPLTLEDQ